uniref:DNA mismatch repair protein MutS n=1 Tax=Anthurium amnicola TaxID=1678845 RepID=A0A1D1YX64_9ARAE
MGQRLYQLKGLKDSTWYEVKISYPASIPASFSIQLRREMPDIWSGKNRRLLNTEKLIFKANIDQLIDAYVLVTVEAAGFVAMPHARERETVLFNIVCDELSFGIPHKAWCVGILAVLCLLLAVIAPYYLPSNLLTKNQIIESKELASLKAS